MATPSQRPTEPSDPGSDTEQVRLQSMSRSSLQAVRVIDSNDDDDDRADALWAIFMSVHRQGEAALVRWALELQSLVRPSKGNYLHALCWILNESRPRSARSFAETLGRRGIAIGPDSGHYENLAHLDPSATVPELPKDVGETPIGFWVDDFSHAGYDLRPGGDMGARQKSAPVSKAAAPTKSASAGTAKPAAASKEVVTGRVATRINLAKDRTRTTPLRSKTGYPVSAGWEHLVKGHYEGTLGPNRSLFTIPQDELRTILQSKLVVQSPVTRMSGGQFVRTVDVGRTVGTASLKQGGGPTSVIRVITDKAGNLITAFPF